MVIAKQRVWQHTWLSFEKVPVWSPVFSQMSGYIAVASLLLIRDELFPINHYDWTKQSIVHSLSKWPYLAKAWTKSICGGSILKDTESHNLYLLDSRIKCLCYCHSSISTFKYRSIFNSQFWKCYPNKSICYRSPDFYVIKNVHHD